MKITKHAQSCLLVETGGTKILVDPGTFVFGDEGLKPEDFTDIDILIFTHEHPDHFDIENVKKIIAQNHPDVLGTHAVAEALKDISKVNIISAGFQHKFSGFSIEGYPSKHGPLTNGNVPPPVSGVVIDDGENRLYAPGDTIFLDQSARADIVAVPICGKVVMDVETAKAEVLKLNPKIVFPYHYDNPTFPVDVADFALAMQSTPVETKILNWSESIEA